MDEPRDIFDILGEAVSGQIDHRPRPDRAPYVGTWVNAESTSILDLRTDGSFFIEDDWIGGGGAWQVRDDQLILDGQFSMTMSMVPNGVEQDVPASSLRSVIENGPPVMSVDGGQLELRAGDHRVNLQRRP